MRYFVKIGDREHEVVLDGGAATVDGEAAEARLAEVDGSPIRLLSVGDAIHSVVIRRGESKGRFSVSVGGWRFEVEALDERTRTIRELSGASAGPKGPAPLVAPMPGLVVRVHAEVGDQVQPGQGLVVMEAMKMENELRAAAAGTVKAVHARPGTAVEKGALLVELE